MPTRPVLDIPDDVVKSLARNGDRRLTVGGGTGSEGAFTVSRAPLRASPEANAPRLTEGLLGERFFVHDRLDNDDGNWLWGQAAVDGYVGYVAAADVGFDGAAPSHRIKAPLSHAYAEADLKSPSLRELPLAARIRVVGQPKGAFVEAEGLGWVPSRHILAFDESVDDIAATALGFAGSPYLWGGRSITGLDCSALVQLSAALAGHALPRDSDMQAAAAGASLEDIDWAALAAGASGLARGDLVFFEGHVGIMADAVSLIHANATHMMTVAEPLAEVIARLQKKKGGEPVTGVRRLT